MLNPVQNNRDAKKRPSAADLLNDPFLGDAANDDNTLAQFHMYRGMNSRLDVRRTAYFLFLS